MHFPYSTLHKSFEKEFEGKLFQKFSLNGGAGAKPPQRKKQQKCISHTARYIKVLKRSLRENFFKSFPSIGARGRSPRKEKTAKVHFPYSTLHKFFEKKFEVKLFFKKVFPQWGRGDEAPAKKKQQKCISHTARYIKVLKRSLRENFFKSFPQWGRGGKAPAKKKQQKCISHTARYIKVLKRGLGKNFFKSFSKINIKKIAAKKAAVFIHKR